MTSETQNQQTGFIDAISFTFRPARFDLVGLVRSLHVHCGEFGYVERKAGLHGFSKSVDLPGLGMVAYGGDTQKGRVLVQLLGVACSRISDWPRFVRWLHAIDAKLTRLDLAVDILDGEAYSVDAAASDYRSNKFGVGGRRPKAECYGDWLNGRSRTLYVGSIQSGKLLRVYEKGHQLKSTKWPHWVRIELELHPKDRAIPMVAVLNPLPFLAGAYPALHWLHQYEQKIKTAREIAERTLKAVLAVARNQAGRAAHAALLHAEGDKERAFDLLHRHELPAKLVGFRSIAENTLKDRDHVNS